MSIITAEAKSYTCLPDEINKYTREKEFIVATRKETSKSYMCSDEYRYRCIPSFTTSGASMSITWTAMMQSVFCEKKGLHRERLDFNHLKSSMR